MVYIMEVYMKENVKEFADHVFNKEWNEVYSTEQFEKEMYYNGDDLGAVYLGNNTVFKLWSPFAKSVRLNLYKSGDQNANDLIESHIMDQEDKGIWKIEINQNIENIYYTYFVAFDEKYHGLYDCEICDPYAKACGVNGKRAMVVNLENTNPDGWDKDKNPNINLPTCESIIYELHVRDLSSDQSSGIVHAGKFLGLTERNTTVNNKGVIPTGISHIKNLGVTHIHFLPIYDYAMLDETTKDLGDEYNWGYDPLNYNIPEGSYSTNPYDGNIRITELKKMVQSLHNDGISVIMDVVYNHTFNEEYCYNKAVPGYFHRIDEEGIRSNGSACGNDTASERAMVSKYIVDSVLYWAKEYHIDGFRFDLVGLIDVDTINKIRDGLNAIRPNIMMYGEGWILDTNLTKKDVALATQKNINLLNDFAMFNDDIRDAVKGNVFDEEDKGFVSGNTKMIKSLKKSIMGMPDWSNSPDKVINYTSCHDNYTLFDKIRMCDGEKDFNTYVKQNLLAAAIVLLSQGIPLLHAGEEILREKVDSDGKYVSDSVRHPDSVNSIKWDNLNKKEYFETCEYYKGLIKFRKSHPLLMLNTKEKIEQHMEFFSLEHDEVIAYRLYDEKEEMIVIFNSLEKSFELKLENSHEYDIYIKGNKAGVDCIGKCADRVFAEPISCTVVVYSES